MSELRTEIATGLNESPEQTLPVRQRLRRVLFLFETVFGQRGASVGKAAANAAACQQRHN